MKKESFVKSTVKLQFKAKEIIIEVYQNLPDIPGLDFESAVYNWEARTNKYTAESLCNYINGKNTGYHCLTVEQFNNLK